jgi:RimJ/RimL family protein N-acetyltransferase
VSVEQFGCTPELYDALDHDRVWEHIPGTRPKSPESLAALLTVPERQPLIIRDRGAIVGTSSYLFDPDRSHEVEIGATLLTPSAWGTGVNAQAKHIMVDAAFSAGPNGFCYARTSATLARKRRSSNCLAPRRSRR